MTTWTYLLFAGSMFVAGFLSSAVAGGDWHIRTIAGSGDAVPSELSAPQTTAIGNPFGVEIGPDGGLYICEVSNHRLWRLDRQTKRLTIVAGTGDKGYDGDGGPATAAKLNEPYEVRFDRAGNLFFVEMQNHVVRKIDARTGVISTVAGNGTAGFGGDGGPATSAQLRQPHSIALDDLGNLFIADIGNHRIRCVQLETGTIETFAGNRERQLPADGQPVTGTPVLGPRALYITGRTLWVALREGNSLWRISLDEPRWQRIAGTGQAGFSGDGGPALSATLNGPKGVAVRDSDVFIVDTENQAIRHIDLRTGDIATVAGQGPSARGFQGDGEPATSAHLNRPHGICVDTQGCVVIGDSENHRVRELRR